MATINHHQKHQNQVRIIGGSHRGRKINFQSAEGLRPTADSVRERLFNWLGQDLTGLSVLDLFAGSGALGFEAASRNAARVIMVESNKQTTDNLKKHIDIFGFGEHVVIQRQTAQEFLLGNKQTFDIVLLDPPFAWQQWAELFELLQNHLKNEAFIYIEAEELPICPQWLETYRQGRAGQSRFAILRPLPKLTGKHII